MADDKWSQYFTPDPQQAPTTSDTIAPNNSKWNQYFTPDPPGTSGMPNLRDNPLSMIKGDTNLRATPSGEDVAPLAGRIAVQALPAIGGTIGGIAGTGGSPSLVFNPITGGMAGATLGSAAKGYLQNKFPSLFGEDENKDNPMGAAVDIGKDALLQGALPEGAALGGKQILSKILASKPAQLFPSVQKGTEAAQAAELANVGSREGVDVRAVLKSGSTGSGKYNPEKIMTELNNPDYQFTISPEMKKNVSDFAANLHQLKAGEGSSNYIINYAKAHLILGGATALATGSEYMAGTVAAAGGLVLTDHILGKLMNNPETAQLVVRAMRTPSTAPEADLIQKALMGAARGSLAVSQTEDK